MFHSFSSRCAAVLALVLPMLQTASAIPVTNRAGAPMDGVNVTVSPLPLVYNETATISWTGGDEPWKLLIGTGGYYADPIDWRIEEGALEIKQVNWTVSFDVGESVIFQVWDVQNKTGYIQNLVIEANNGTDTAEPGPVEPVEPVEPTEPAEPVEPTEPVETVEPAEPVEPVEPVEPSQE